MAVSVLLHSEFLSLLLLFQIESRTGLKKGVLQVTVVSDGAKEILAG